MKFTFDEENVGNFSSKRARLQKNSFSPMQFVINHSGGRIKTRTGANVLLLLTIALSIFLSYQLIGSESEIRPVPSQAIPLNSAR